MSDTSSTPVRFRPSRTEGLLNVDEVAIYADRLELMSAGMLHVFRFEEIGRPQVSRAKNLVMRLLRRPACLQMVGERDWFHSPPDMFFEWYTSPPIRTYMPVDECKDSYTGSYFFRIRQAVESGGYGTYDLG